MNCIDCPHPRACGPTQKYCRIHTVSPWFPMDNVNDVRVMGKFQEELGECTSAAARCLIQGIDEKEPTTGKVNRQWLEEEIADVKATMEHVIMQFGLDEAAINVLVRTKSVKLQRWLDIIERPVPPPGYRMTDGSTVRTPIEPDVIEGRRISHIDRDGKVTYTDGQP